MRKETTCKQPRTQWSALKDANQLAFQEKLGRKRGTWRVMEHSMEEMSGCIKRVTSKVLGKSKGVEPRHHEYLWRNEEVQRIRAKNSAIGSCQKQKVENLCRVQES